jgi:hypothetical protein
MALELIPTYSFRDFLLSCFRDWYLGFVWFLQFDFCNFWYLSWMCC